MSNQEDNAKPAEDISTEKIAEGLKHITDIVEGKVSLQELANISNREVQAILAVGSLLYMQGRLTQAEDLFRGAVVINKNNQLAQSGLGTVLTAEGKLDEAYAALTEAIRLKEDDIASYVNRGEVQLRLGKFHEALLDLRKAIDLDPEAKDSGANRARAIVIGIKAKLEEIQKEAEEEEARYSQPFSPTQD